MNQVSQTPIHTTCSPTFRGYSAFVTTDQNPIESPVSLPEFGGGCIVVVQSNESDGRNPGRAAAPHFVAPLFVFILVYVHTCAVIFGTTGSPSPALFKRPTNAVGGLRKAACHCNFDCPQQTAGCSRALHAFFLRFVPSQALGMVLPVSSPL